MLTTEDYNRKQINCKSRVCVCLRQGLTVEPSMARDSLHRSNCPQTCRDPAHLCIHYVRLNITIYMSLLSSLPLCYFSLLVLPMLFPRCRLSPVSFNSVLSRIPFQEALFSLSLPSSIIPSSCALPPQEEQAPWSPSCYVSIWGPLQGSEQRWTSDFFWCLCNSPGKQSYCLRPTGKARSAGIKLVLVGQVRESCYLYCWKICPRWCSNWLVLNDPDMIPQA